MTPRGFTGASNVSEAAHRTPQESTQSERRSTPRFEKGLYFLNCHLDFIDIIVYQQPVMINYGLLTLLGKINN